MNRITFERFLQNLEIYTDLRKRYRERAKQQYDAGRDYLIVEEEMQPDQDVIDNQVDILQNIFEAMMKED